MARNTNFWTSNSSLKCKLNGLLRFLSNYLKWEPQYSLSATWLQCHHGSKAQTRINNRTNERSSNSGSNCLVCCIILSNCLLYWLNNLSESQRSIFILFTNFPRSWLMKKISFSKFIGARLKEACLVKWFNLF